MTTTNNLGLELVSGTETFDTDKVMNNFTEIDTAVGNPESLTTTAKTDLVAAINEVDGNIGDLSGLSTTAKENLVSAVNELNQNTNDVYRMLGAGTLVDLNNVTYFIQNKLQVYRVSNSSTNNPESGRHGFLFHMDIDSSAYAIQVLFLLGGTKLYMRSKQSGEWQGWIPIG